MLDASHVLQPPRPFCFTSKRRFAAGSKSRPHTASMLKSCPRTEGLRTGSRPPRSCSCVQPVGDCFFIPVRQWTIAHFIEHAPNAHMQVLNRPLAVDRYEVKDHRQCVVLLYYAADELLITFVRIFDIRHILPGLIVLRRARSPHTDAARFRRNGKVENRVRPV